MKCNFSSLNLRVPRVECRIIILCGSHTTDTHPPNNNHHSLLFIRQQKEPFGDAKSLSEYVSSNSITHKYRFDLYLVSSAIIWKKLLPSKVINLRWLEQRDRHCVQMFGGVINQTSEGWQKKNGIYQLLLILPLIYHIFIIQVHKTNTPRRQSGWGGGFEGLSIRRNRCTFSSPLISSEQIVTSPWKLKWQCVSLFWSTFSWETTTEIKQILVQGLEFPICKH